jgi:hypothetical protein
LLMRAESPHSPFLTMGRLCSRVRKTVRSSCSALQRRNRRSTSGRSALSGKVVRWEYKAVALGSNEDDATKRLNQLAEQRWQLIGPLGNGLTAFKRPESPSCPTSVDTDNSGPDKDLKTLAGKWRLVGGEIDGRSIPKDQFPSEGIIIQLDGSGVLINEGKEKTNVCLAVNSTIRPKTITGGRVPRFG